MNDELWLFVVQVSQEDYRSSGRRGQRRSRQRAESGWRPLAKHAGLQRPVDVVQPLTAARLVSGGGGVWAVVGTAVGKSGTV
jgi:hypothetical protein